MSRTNYAKGEAHHRRPFPALASSPNQARNQEETDLIHAQEEPIAIPQRQLIDI